MWKSSFLVDEAWYDVPWRYPRRRGLVKILSLAVSASEASLRDSVSDEVDLSTAPRRMLMMTGRSYPGTSSRFGRRQVMSERTCCFPCAGMTGIHQMLLPY